MIHCQVCNNPFKNINKRHLAHHNMSREEYVQKFPDAPLQSAESAAQRHEAALKREANLSAEVLEARSKKISEKRTGQSSWNAGKGGYTLEWSDEARQRNAERVHWNLGGFIPEEQKQKASKTMLEKYSSGELVHWNLGNITPEKVKQKISEGNTGKIFNEERLQNHIKAMRIKVSSPDYVNSRAGVKLTDEERQVISEKSLEAAPRVRASMEAAGHWIPLDQVPALTKYKRQVWKLTNKVVHLIPNFDPAKRGLCSKTEDNWQVDHRLSILEGYLQEVPAEIISHPANLRFIPWRENLQKWHKSDLTLEELTKLIKA